MENEKNRFVRALADEENGCEECWEALAADCERLGLPDPYGGDLEVLVPAEWVGRPCPHGAPSYAPSILLPVEK